jgi:hypothetical protein
MDGFIIVNLLGIVLRHLDELESGTFYGIAELVSA